MNRESVFRGLYVLSVLLCLFLPSRAEGYVLDREHINMDYGLPARMVYDIDQDADGYIWFTSQLGIHRFDGDRFKTWTTSELDLPDRYPPQIRFDHHNQLWFPILFPGSRLGAIRAFDCNGDSSLDASAMLPPDFKGKKVRLLVNWGPGKSKYFLLEDRDLYRLDSTLDHIGTVPESGLTYYYVADFGGRVLIFNSRRVFEFSSGKAYIYPGYKFGESVNFDHVLNWEGEPIFFTPSAKSGAYQLRNGEIQPWESPVKLPENGIFVWGDSTKILYATSDSLFFLFPGKDDASAFPISRFEYQTLKMRKKGIQDKQGNIWIGTEDGILKYHLRPNPFKVLKKGKSVYGIAKIGKELFVSGAKPEVNAGISHLWDQFPKPQMGINFIQKTRDGNLWMMPMNGVMFEYDPVKDEIFQHGDFPRVAFRAFYEFADEDKMWLGSSNGLFQGFRSDPAGALKTVDTLIFPKKNRQMMINSFSPGKLGIWVGTSEGIFQLDSISGKIKRRISVEEGLPFGNVNDLLEDENEVLWVATRGGGLIRIDLKNDQIRQFTTNDGLSHNNLYKVVPDKQGVLWLPGDFGLIAFNPRTFAMRIFHEQSGITHEEFNTNSFFRDEEGKFYFGGLGGITVFDPKEVNLAEAGEKAPLRLENAEVLLSGEDEYFTEMPSYYEKGKVVIQPGTQILRLSFSYLDFWNTRKNEIAYRIPGYQDDWVYTKESTVSLIHLPYGKYSIEVKGRGAEGVWSGENLILALIVERPFYLKPWFICLMLVLLGVLIWVIVKIRIKSLQTDRKRLALEVKKRTRKIEAQARELEEMNRIKSDFFSNITHEFRTPLTLVIGPAKQMIENEAPSPFREAFESILRNGRQLLGLINQLLDLSKLENESIKVELSRGEIVSFTRELVNQFRPLAVQKQLSLSFSSSVEEWETGFDKIIWQKTVYNLLSNAIKFSSFLGQVSVELTMEKTENQNWVILSVSDHGVGIAPEEVKRIFNRFYQVNSSSTRIQGGTGIGLALVRELVELHEGTISVESTLGEGTCFTVRIPVYEQISLAMELNQLEKLDEFLISQQNEASAGIPATHPPKIEARSGQEVNAEKYCVLLIEDHPDMRSYIRSCLDEKLYDVREATNGTTGIQLAKKIVPDLIISDVMMPGHDGFEVTREIRSHIATSHIPIILLTARAALDSRMEGISRGADAYLTKPFNPGELMLRVLKLIELRKALQKRFSVLTQPDFHLKKSEKGEPDAEEMFMKELQEFIFANLAEPDMNVEKIARHFGISRTQLYRKIKVLTNFSVKEMVRNLRLEKARELLRDQALSISEVAYQTGFSSPSYFSVAYKKHFGISPKETLPLNIPDMCSLP